MEYSQINIIGMALILAGTIGVATGKVSISGRVGGPGVHQSNWQPMNTKTKRFNGLSVRISSVVLFLLGAYIVFFSNHG